MPKSGRPAREAQTSSTEPGAETGTPHSVRLRAMLATVRGVRIAVRDARGLHFIGEGEVEVRVDAAGSIVLVECGEWRGPAGRMRFRNRWRWRFDGEYVKLAHERRGAGRAVELVRLDEIGPCRWSSAQPHECGADGYSAELRITAGEIVLKWRVHGPRKMQLIRSTWLVDQPAGLQGSTTPPIIATFDARSPGRLRDATAGIAARSMSRQPLENTEPSNEADRLPRRPCRLE